jgi:Uma2 family endonuclease
MQIEVNKKLFTVDEYYQMAAAGILRPEDRVELIDGEIVQMSPIGDRHALCVMIATNLFARALGTEALINVQNPLRLNKYTEPQPDIVVLKPRTDYYKHQQIRPEDTLLVVEVSDSSVRYDQKIKLPRYAAAGIPEVWIENLQMDELLVYRDLKEQSYTVCLTLRRSDSVSPGAFSDVSFRIDDLLG